MESKQYVSALDIGTSKVVAVIGEIADNNLHIVGFGETESRGMKAGMLTNIDVTAQAIRQAMHEAELMADCKITSVTAGISGNHVRSFNSQGVVKIKDGEVSRADIERTKETAKAVAIPPDHQILHTVVQEYIIDNQPGVREPVGMSGVRLDTRVHIITGAVTAVQNVQKCIERCNLQAEQHILNPLASAQAVLTEDEKELGVCVIDIGAGTTDIAVYTNGAIRHTAVIPIAGDLITRDLAQALRTPYSSAEYIKVNFGAAAVYADNGAEMDQMVEVPSVGDRPNRRIARSVLATVIGPRVEEILELALNELRRNGFPEQVLTSGIVLTGGTAMLQGMELLAEDVFNLPVRIGVPHRLGGVSERTRHPRYAGAIGLLNAAKTRAQEHGISAGTPNIRPVEQSAPIQTQSEQHFYERDDDMAQIRPHDNGPSLFARLRNWAKNNL